MQSSLLTGDKPRARTSHGCVAAQMGRAYYLTVIEHYARLMSERFVRSHEHARTCVRVRELAKLARAKAIAWHKRYEAWRDEWNWQAWLPDKFARVGACETGYGRRPGNWAWDSGTYVSAFGIYRPAYAQFAGYLGLPSWDEPGVRTPREQYLVARAIQARFGWGAWGCGGA